MNRREYLEACCKKVVGIREWEYKTRRKLKRGEFGLDKRTDENATVIHHLIETEEQRKYNDEHYEMWGHNLDGTFEYGKYVVFWTKEHHDSYHNESSITKDKISNGLKLVWERPGYREYVSRIHREYYENNPDARENISKHLKAFFENPENREKASARAYKKYEEDPDIKKRISESRKGQHAGEDHWLYGKQHSEETKAKISATQKANMTDEHKKLISETTKLGMQNPDVIKKIVDANTGENNPNYGKPRTDETKSKISSAKREYMLKLSAVYKEYKQNGGTLGWVQFQTYARDNKLL